MKRRSARSFTARTRCTRRRRGSVPGRWATFHPNAAISSDASSNRRASVRYTQPHQRQQEEERARPTARVRRPSFLSTVASAARSSPCRRLRPSPVGSSASPVARCRTRASGVIRTRNPRDARPPAEIDVAVAVEPLVEQAHASPRLASHEGAHSVDREHLQHAIELPLVDLPGLQRRVGMAEPIRGPPDVAEPPRVVVVDDLGADDARRRRRRGVCVASTSRATASGSRTASSCRSRRWSAARGGRVRGAGRERRGDPGRRRRAASRALGPSASTEEVVRAVGRSRRRPRARRRAGESATPERAGSRGARRPLADGEEDEDRRDAVGEVGGAVDAVMRGALPARRRA